MTSADDGDGTCTYHNSDQGRKACELLISVISQKQILEGWRDEEIPYANCCWD